LAERVSTLKPSVTVELTERVRQARLAGRPVIGLSSGDPNIETDKRIVAAAERSMRAGETHYGPPNGIEALREAIVAREARLAGARYDADDVIVTPGGKFALLTALMAVVEPGDEVLVPEPGWVSYGPCVRLCGGTPVRVVMLDEVRPEAVEQAITPRTQAIIVNSPVNPTGRVIPREELDALAALAQRHGLWVIFDQVYSDLLHEGRFAYVQSDPEMKERTFVVDSFSKTFGMTGWRLGYLACPAGRAKAVVKFLQHSIYCVPAFVQAAGIRALALYDELVPGYRTMFRRRLERLAARLVSQPGIRCSVPDATFYLFAAVDTEDIGLARFWLDAIDVAVLPGSSFGAAGAGHVRFSATCSDADLEEALDRIARVGLRHAA
jgi:aspartate aminotransferase